MSIFFGMGVISVLLWRPLLSLITSVGDLDCSHIVGDYGGDFLMNYMAKMMAQLTGPE